MNKKVNDLNDTFSDVVSMFGKGKSPVVKSKSTKTGTNTEEPKQNTKYNVKKNKIKSNKRINKATNVKKIHHRAKKLQHKIRSHKPANNFTFGVKHKRHKIQYGNLRVNIDIVRQLKLLQQALGLRSRSALLKQMVQYCKPAILSDSSVKSQYKIYKKSMKTNLEAKKMNK